MRPRVSAVALGAVRVFVIEMRGYLGAERLGAAKESGIAGDVAARKTLDLDGVCRSVGAEQEGGVRRRAG